MQVASKARRSSSRGACTSSTSCAVVQRTAHLYSHRRTTTTTAAEAEAETGTMLHHPRPGPVDWSAEHLQGFMNHGRDWQVIDLLTHLGHKCLSCTGNTCTYGLIAGYKALLHAPGGGACKLGSTGPEVHERGQGSPIRYRAVATTAINPLLASTTINCRCIHNRNHVVGSLFPNVSHSHDRGEGAVARRDENRHRGSAI